MDLPNKNGSFATLKIPNNMTDIINEKVSTLSFGLPIFTLPGIYNYEISDYIYENPHKVQIAGIAMLFHNVSFCNIPKYEATILALKILSTVHRLMDCIPHIIQLTNFPPSSIEQQFYCNQSILQIHVRLYTRNVKTSLKNIQKELLNTEYMLNNVMFRPLILMNTVNIVDLPILLIKEVNKQLTLQEISISGRNNNSTCISYENTQYSDLVIYNRSYEVDYENGFMDFNDKILKVISSKEYIPLYFLPRPISNTNKFGESVLVRHPSNENSDSLIQKIYQNFGEKCLLIPCLFLNERSNNTLTIENSLKNTTDILNEVDIPPRNFTLIFEFPDHDYCMDVSQDFRKFAQSLKNFISVSLSIKPSDVRILPTPIPMNITAAESCTKITPIIHTGTIAFVEILTNDIYSSIDKLNRPYHKRYKNPLGTLFGRFNISVNPKELIQLPYTKDFNITSTSLSSIIFASNHQIIPITLLIPQKDEIEEDKIIPKYILILLKSFREISLVPIVINYKSIYIVTLG
ncbi:uncharacterized protein CMU_010410 [Cryptosporidium muris RN66]|uniref:Uncharacterized protein n=1 Tax=Cryptosporidium muris (strain RN66) TaxID=441375 RepID=B6AK74_CRYMR|nr:uncharacterized protein CMU_010410 [Cryptosporidium muris RN66]EEA08615.1 hypothetical protein CMU_010410 [Cryptosporidium muris RN66]|eukprot:XP_002142964.1 hypothetical protein [Cryptosporidium muris RN66]